MDVDSRFYKLLLKFSNNLQLFVYSRYANYDANKQTDYEIALYFIMGISGVLGNIVTCVVIANNKSMRTVTNAYLFNLAISDLLILVFGFPPWHRYVKYPFDGFCKLRNLMSECAINVSVLTISVLSVERYLAICHPFKAHALSDVSRASRTISIIWLVGLVCALPISLQIGLVPKNLFIDDDTCSVIRDFAFEILSSISSFIFFVLPMLLIGCLYTMIGLRFRSSGLIVDHQSARVNVKGKVIRMLVTVVIVFFVCWAPFHLQRLLSQHLRKIVELYQLFKAHLIFSRVTGVLYYSSAVVNPIIYNIMSSKFRQAFKVTFIRGFKRLRCFGCTSMDDD